METAHFQTKGWISNISMNVDPIISVEFSRNCASDCHIFLQIFQLQLKEYLFSSGEYLWDMFYPSEQLYISSHKKINKLLHHWLKPNPPLFEQNNIYSLLICDGWNIRFQFQTCHYMKTNPTNSLLERTFKNIVFLLILHFKTRTSTSVSHVHWRIFYFHSQFRL